MSSFDIEWKGNFYGIYWAYEKDRLVVSTVFEDKEEAHQLAKEVENWSDKFTRMTLIEKNNDEYALCCYQDPQISKSEKNLGLYRSGMRQAGGYERAKPMIEERSPLLQIAYAADVRSINTYEQVSRLVPIKKCRIIKEADLKKQEYFFERTAHKKNLEEDR
ncbi:MAG: hypothetical protein H2B05_04650 [Nitrosopumilaceae archaeon]|jgi:hypothetical protein|uniref:Uncharacterized protein n=2 Tax=Candidatus Nitrosomaritimum aestuariumsis TaxID=3342354 RepID=A0AC60W9H2_9ARCH|nr:hypothetical protein [Nitrosopumilaceae archaeon]MBA4460159.1 hypothetical protein [Nitrosopumilaceae archaeon]MBA4461663.1 hypothetical protein [Nitrosopumilaceae archaeon]MBA4463401.1 hypothetical protein [Nitrosopumilaceae archaeon]NCF21924.1 hypothetical protein [Nitrosopumilaceae archaeon]